MLHPLMSLTRVLPRLLLLITVLSALIFNACAPETKYQYGITPVHEIEAYQTIIEANPQNELVNLERFIPGMQMDIKYATADNFVKQAVYNMPRAYCRKPVAMALRRAQNEFVGQNLGLKIYDAYRPYSVTVKFYELYPDTTYVASPYSGSRHNRGAAIDLTLVDLKTGKELDMGTAYDDFREIAHPTYQQLPEQVLKNRQLLIRILNKHGFTVYPSEWWHFDFKGWEQFELLDLSFEDLENNQKK